MPTSGAFSDYFEDKLALWFKGTTFIASPANLYVALFTANPTDAGGGTEVSGNGYARQAVASSAWTETTPTTSLTNTNDITFPVNTSSDWGTITGVGIFDALTTGNLIWWSAATTNKLIQVGDQYVIKATNLVLTID